MGHSYTKKLFVVYLKFQFNWVSWIWSGTPKLERNKGLKYCELDLQRSRISKDHPDSSALKYQLFCRERKVPDIL